MKKYIKKEFLFFIVLFIWMLTIIINRPLSELDEIWNYNFARNIANGLMPYRDFNIIVTPLLSIIVGIILKITIDELIIVRIVTVFFYILIILEIHKIFKLLKINKIFFYFFSIVLTFIIKDIFYLDYNWASAYATLIIVYYELKFYLKNENFFKFNIKNDIFLGILAAIVILLKQTVGLCVCIVLLGNRLLFVRKKEDIKLFIKVFICRLIGILIPILIFILYLLKNQAFGDFISYTITGILEFSNKISYKSLLKINFTGLLSILIPILFIYEWGKTVIFEKNKLIYLILVYAIATFSICFPISNESHFYVASLVTFIMIVYEVHLLVLKCKMTDKMSEIIKRICIIYYIIINIYIICYCILNINRYVSNIKSCQMFNHFNLIYTDECIIKDIEETDTYIISNFDKVKILDSQAAIYMIPINKYNKDYDMFNMGNLGKNGTDRIINEIKEEKNMKYLILKDEYQQNWQTPKKIINYVKNNKTKVGEVSIYDVYE